MTSSKSSGPLPPVFLCTGYDYLLALMMVAAIVDRERMLADSELAMDVELLREADM